jgi:hypothetical protein
MNDIQTRKMLKQQQGGVTITALVSTTFVRAIGCQEMGKTVPV